MTKNFCARPFGCPSQQVCAPSMLGRICDPFQRRLRYSVRYSVQPLVMLASAAGVFKDSRMEFPRLSDEHAAAIQAELDGQARLFELPSYDTAPWSAALRSVHFLEASGFEHCTPRSLGSSTFDFLRRPFPNCACIVYGGAKESIVGSFTLRRL